MARHTLPEDTDVVVVGAGCAGLACAAQLQAAGARVLVLEASHHVGGRLHTMHEQALPWPSMHTPWLRRHAPAGRRGSLGDGHAAFELGGEFIHGPNREVMAVLREHHVPVRRKFTWAHGDGGPSGHHHARREE